MPPRSAIAKPTSRGNIPNPPSKKSGGCRLSTSPTGVLKNIAHRLENVPKCPAITKCADMVHTTLNVQMRRNGSLRFRFGLFGLGMAGSDSLVVMGEYGVVGEVGSSFSCVS